MILFWVLVWGAIWGAVSALIWGFGERQFFNKTGIRYVKAEEIVQDVLSRTNCSNLTTLKDWILRCKMDLSDAHPANNFEILVIENYDPEEWQLITIFWPILGFSYLVEKIINAGKWFFKNTFSGLGNLIFKCLRKMFLAVSEVVMLGASRAESEMKENNFKGPYR
jgi:hypothetical protein